MAWAPRLRQYQAIALASVLGLEENVLSHVVGSHPRALMRWEAASSPPL
jgi:hypothetical protein